MPVKTFIFGRPYFNLSLVIVVGLPLTMNKLLELLPQYIKMCLNRNEVEIFISNCLRAWKKRDVITLWVLLYGRHSLTPTCFT